MIPASTKTGLSLFLPAKLDAYYRLFRLDKPVGIELLLWPTLWSLWLGAGGFPGWNNIIIFSIGTVLMRSAGCAINDFADRDFDRQVERTTGRPLALGQLTGREALAAFAVLVLGSASLLLWLPLADFYWSFGAVALATLYPFMKRVTYFPQVVLGAAFSWAIPMAFVAVHHWPDILCWQLYAANLAWTVAYDTQYAMTDRPDDVHAGVKSTAIWLGKWDNLAIASLQVIFLSLMSHVLLNTASWHWTALFLVMTVAGFGYQHILTRNRERQACFRAFLANRWTGRGVFLVVFGALSLAP